MEGLPAGRAALRETVALAALHAVQATTRIAAAVAVSDLTGLQALAGALALTPLIGGRAPAVVSILILRDALVRALRAGLPGSLGGGCSASSAAASWGRYDYCGRRHSA